jgi:ADP-heptose:LPS heptosyltransferase
MNSHSIKIVGRGSHLRRHADRYVGIPIVAMLGAFRRRRPIPTRLDRVGLLTTAAIGDTVLLSGVIADLRAALPAAHLTLFAGESNHAMAQMLTGPDRVVRLEPHNPVRTVRVMREDQFDLLIDFGPWPRLNAIFTALARARFTVGFRTPRQMRHFAYDLAVDHSPDVHELENHRRIIRRLGFATAHPPSIDLRRLPRDAGLALRGPYIVLHLWPSGSRGRQREWPIDRWVALANHFAENGYDICLTGASAQRSANEAVLAIADPHRRAQLHNAAGLSLAASATLLARARLVVSVDTGLMHLAAALGVPVIGLCGPASSRRWGPIGDRASAIDSPHPAAGYSYLGFEMPRRPPPLMEAITLDSVLAECAKKLLVYDAQLSRLARAASH